MREYRRRYREKNPDQNKIASARYREKHKNDPEFRRKNIERYKKWVENNPEKYSRIQRESQKKWRLKNSDKIRKRNLRMDTDLRKKKIYGKQLEKKNCSYNSIWI